MSDLDWKIVCLEVDEPSKEIGKFIKKLWPERVSSVQIYGFWDSVEKEHLKELLWQFRNIDGRILTVYGSGLFHHFTYGLLRNIADLRSTNYSYFHIDQHTDDSYDDDTEFKYLFHCGNFVRDIKARTLAKKVKYLGCERIYSKIDKKDIVNTTEIEKKGVKKSLFELLSDSPKQVYVSMDLDVLKPDQMKTGWPDGVMDINTFLEALNYINSNQTIISADALGLSGDKHCKNLWDASLLVYAMIAGNLFGEDISEFRKEHALLTKFK